MMQGDEITVDTVKKILEAFNRHDLNAIMAFFADDSGLEMPRGPHPFPVFGSSILVFSY